MPEQILLGFFCCLVLFCFLNLNQGRRRTESGASRLWELLRLSGLERVKEGEVQLCELKYLGLF